MDNIFDLYKFSLKPPPAHAVTDRARLAHELFISRFVLLFCPEAQIHRPCQVHLLSPPLLPQRQ